MEKSISINQFYKSLSDIAIYARHCDNANEMCDRLEEEIAMIFGKEETEKFIKSLI